MRNIHPHIAKVRRGLADLRKDIPGFVDAALVRQNSPDAVGCPNVLGVIAHHLLVHGERPVLVALLAILVFGGVVQRLQPNITWKQFLFYLTHFM